MYICLHRVSDVDVYLSVQVSDVDVYLSVQVSEQ